MEDVVHEAVEDLHTTIEVAKAEAAKKAALQEEGAEEEEEEESPTKAELAQELLTKIDEGMANNNGKIEEIYITKFIRERLLSSPSQNQGFVLDNYPDSYARAAALFGHSGDAEDGPDPGANERTDESTEAGDFDPRIIPGKLTLIVGESFSEPSNKSFPSRNVLILLFLSGRTFFCLYCDFVEHVLITYEGYTIWDPKKILKIFQISSSFWKRMRTFCDR